MSQKDSYDLAIVGGGPGGLSAVIYAVRANLKTVLLEHGLPGGQLNITDEVENYLGFGKVNGSELALSFINHAKLYNFETINREVLQLNKIGKLYNLVLSDNQTIRSSAVILATGGHPKKLQIPGEAQLYGNGVSYCATCDGFFFKNKTVLVIGGGNSAAQEALYLAKICQKVYLIHRRDNLRASKILQKRIASNNNIITLWNTIANAILAGKDGVSGVKLMNVKTNKTETLEVNGVFIFIGYEPNNQLIPKEVPTDSQGMVITNESCETNMPGLYVVGDLRSKPARQIILSAADGCNAALAVSKYIENIEAI